MKDIFVFDEVQHLKSKIVREVLEALEDLADDNSIILKDDSVNGVRKRLYRRLDRLHRLILEE